VAEIHVLLANGGVAKGKRILSEAGCRKALEVQIEGDDLVLGVPAKYGLGFGLPGPMIPLPSPGSMFWGGYGGSLIVIDMDNHTTVSFVMNKMGATTLGDARGMGPANAFWAALSA
jgi:CubicO group peptidase (beta-lactamase class C family)